MSNQDNCRRRYIVLVYTGKPGAHDRMFVTEKSAIGYVVQMRLTYPDARIDMTHVQLNADPDQPAHIIGTYMMQQGARWV